MKIGISVVTYYPDKNGVQFITQNLAEGLVKNGHKVFVITKLNKEDKKESCLNGVNICRCNIKDKNMFHFGDKVGFQRKVIQLSKKVDVMIFVCLQSVAADWSLDILDSISCQKILYMHGMHEFKWSKIDLSSCRDFSFKIFRDLRWSLFYTINRKKIDKFDKFIHLHEKDSAYKFFEKRYPGKNYILENFAEDMFFYTASKKTTKDYYIYVANYFPGKNQLLLLKAFYLMRNQFKLVFLGSQKNQSYFDKLLKEKNKLDRKYKTKKNIVFLENVSRTDIPDYLRNAYGFVMTSRSEHYPISIIEAMACELPILSTDVGIVKYLPGCITVNNNPKDIAVALDRLIESPKMYHNLKKIVKKYAEEKYKFNIYLNKFEKIVFD